MFSNAKQSNCIINWPLFFFTFELMKKRMSLILMFYFIQTINQPIMIVETVCKHIKLFIITKPNIKFNYMILRCYQKLRWPSGLSSSTTVITSQSTLILWVRTRANTLDCILLNVALNTNKKKIINAIMSKFIGL